MFVCSLVFVFVSPLVGLLGKLITVNDDFLLRNLEQVSLANVLDVLELVTVDDSVNRSRSRSRSSQSQRGESSNESGGESHVGCGG